MSRRTYNSRASITVVGMRRERASVDWGGGSMMLYVWWTTCGGARRSAGQDIDTIHQVAADAIMGDG